MCVINLTEGETHIEELIYTVIADDGKCYKRSNDGWRQQRI